jgi:hypothetical protein
VLRLSRAPSPFPSDDLGVCCVHGASVRPLSSSMQRSGERCLGAAPISDCEEQTMDRYRLRGEPQEPARFRDMQGSLGHDQSDTSWYEDSSDAYVEDVVPHYARYTNEETDVYLVRDLAAGGMYRVTKYRAPTPLPARSVSRGPGTAVLRWSVLALIGAVAGGIGGLVLGVPVFLIALVQRASLSWRVRLWRRRHPGRLLPTAARNEHDLVRGALWQSGLATIIGSLVLWFLIAHLW